MGSIYSSLPLRLSAVKVFKLLSTSRLQCHFNILSNCNFVWIGRYFSSQVFKVTFDVSWNAFVNTLLVFFEFVTTKFIFTWFQFNFIITATKSVRCSNQWNDIEAKSNITFICCHCFKMKFRWIHFREREKANHKWNKHYYSREKMWTLFSVNICTRWKKGTPCVC